MSASAVIASPWLTAAEASAYAKHSRRLILRAVRDGRLRAARVGGRREILTTITWLDQWLEDLAQPATAMPIRRRA